MWAEGAFMQFCREVQDLVDMSF